MTTQDEARSGEAGGGRRRVTQVPSLDLLVGAHPEALEQIYRTARPADPAELGDAPRGCLLAIAPGSDVFLMTRPIVQALAAHPIGWRGKTFDHGGNSGQNLVFGKRVLRFHVDVGPSEVDGRPTLRLSYANPAFKNPWIVRDVVDELRGVGPGIAIGPAFRMGATPKLLLWFGLENQRPS